MSALVLTGVVFAAGFGVGYAVRSWVSHQRHRRAGRHVYTHRRV